MNRILVALASKIVPSVRGGYRQICTPMQSRKWFSQNNRVVTEEEIRSILRKKFPRSQTISVEDVSGGCGAMFNIYIESSDFKGLSVVKQHRTVYDTLKEQIKNIHGLHLETKVP